MDKELPKPVRTLRDYVQLSDDEKIEIFIETFEKPLPMWSTMDRPIHTRANLFLRKVADNALISGYGFTVCGEIDGHLALEEEQLNKFMSQLKASPATYKFQA